MAVWKLKALVFSVTGALVIWAALFFQGSAMVIDEAGIVISASTSDGVRLRRFPGGFFYAVPERDGSIQIRCKDGSTADWGYVTSGIHTWLTVHGPKCTDLSED